MLPLLRKFENCWKCLLTCQTSENYIVRRSVAWSCRFTAWCLVMINLHVCRGTSICQIEQLPFRIVSLKLTDIPLCCFLNSETDILGKVCRPIRTDTLSSVRRDLKTRLFQILTTVLKPLINSFRWTDRRFMPWSSPASEWLVVVYCNDLASKLNYYERRIRFDRSSSWATLLWVW